MSETVHYRGRIYKIVIDEEKLEEYCKGELKRFGHELELPSYFDSYSEYLADEEYEKYVMINGDLYEILSKESIEPSLDMYKGRRIGMSEIVEYEVKYYNGGCGFAEAMEYVVEGLDKGDE